MSQETDTAKANEAVGDALESAGFTKAGLAPTSPNCPNLECNAPPSKHEVRNKDLMWGDGDVYCGECGTYIRMFDSG